MLLLNSIVKSDVWEEVKKSATCMYIHVYFLVFFRKASVLILDEINCKV